MGKDIQSRNKKYAKLSAVEAEAKQQIANRRERQRQSAISKAFKELSDLLPPHTNAERTQLEILEGAVHRIKTLEGQLAKRVGVQVTQRQHIGPQTCSGHSKTTGYAPDPICASDNIANVPPVSHYSPFMSSTYQHHQPPVNIQGDLPGRLGSCIYATGPNFGSHDIAVSPMSHNVLYNRHHLPAVNIQSDLPSRLSSCMFQSTPAATIQHFQHTRQDVFQQNTVPSMFFGPTHNQVSPPYFHKW